MIITQDPKDYDKLNAVERAILREDVMTLWQRAGGTDDVKPDVLIDFFVAMTQARSRA